MRSCGLGCTQAPRPPRGRARRRRDGERPRARVPRTSPGRLPASRGLRPHERRRRQAGSGASPPGCFLPPGRNELTSAGLGTRQRPAAPGLRHVSAARAPGPEGGGGAPAGQAARATGAVPPPGGPAEESRRPGRGRRSQGRPEDALRAHLGGEPRPGRKWPPCAAIEPHLLSQLLPQTPYHPPSCAPHRCRATASSSSILAAGCKLLPNTMDF